MRQVHLLKKGKLGFEKPVVKFAALGKGKRQVYLTNCALTNPPSAPWKDE